ncbi:hypothetical protein VTK73DRAFT_2401 [Phialemonium thermophilum]|uniref:Uncharacterized protein n=1 Tax=Phialemonium thermophilum TaxID=223376 RepID=A0ABR3VS67_9PEZI
MTRLAVYAASLVAFVAATAMTFASIATPTWVSYTVTSREGSTFWRTLGLHKSCSSLADPTCRPFPAEGDCGASSSRFCAMWRTTAFLMSLAAVVELATLVGYLVVLTGSGGRRQREKGWRVLGALLVVVAIVQLAAISLVGYLFDHDDQFLVPGWRLDTSWILSTVSASVALLCAAGLAVSVLVLPPEGGYELVGDGA